MRSFNVDLPCLAEKEVSAQKVLKLAQFIISCTVVCYTVCPPKHAPTLQCHIFKILILTSLHFYNNLAWVEIVY